MMNANNPQTPGVYTVEKSAFPPSVAEVPTAIPAFIGYTETAVMNGKSLINKPVLVNSLSEYSQYFGGAPEYKYPIMLVDKTTAQASTDSYDFTLNGKYYKIGPARQGLFYMYNCLRLFYLNGGGPAYIVSVGTYMESSIDPATFLPTESAVPADRDALLGGLDQLPLIQFPKPTMILMPDALTLSNEDCYVIQQQMIAQAGELQDRVALLDIPGGWQSPDTTTVISDFRNNMGVSYLSYAIAYYPWLECAVVDAAELTFANIYTPSSTETAATDPQNINTVILGVPLIGKLAQIAGDMDLLEAQLPVTPALALSGATKGAPYSSWTAAFNASTATDPGSILKDQGTVLASMYKLIYDLGNSGASTQSNSTLKINTPELIAAVGLLANPKGSLAGMMAQVATYEKNFPGSNAAGTALNTLLTSAGITPLTTNPYGTPAPAAGTAFNIAAPQYKNVFNQLLKALTGIVSASSTLLTQFNTALENSNGDYNNIMTMIARQANILPPAAAMAGIYTLVDNTQGVWQAPANRNINAVVQPMVSINDDQQAPLNVDALAGKSINVIRSFYGRGPAIVWGARTMDGNSLDWKYINVRRLMIMIEQSVANAAFQLVFEPNDSSTWKICESMISNFLHTLWAEGALQGASADDAYSVSVGLGKTMTALDILNGIMRVQVELAVVRPAEFIIITYEQEMAKS